MNLNNQENDKQTVIEDLPVDETQQDEVTGGFTPDGKQLVISIKDGPAADGIKGGEGRTFYAYQPGFLGGVSVASD